MNKRYQTKTFEMECLGLLFRTSRSLKTIMKTVDRLGELAKYNCMESLDCPDKILVNRLCRMLAMCGEIKAGFSSELPDFYTYLTNEQALSKMLETLILQSVSRLFRKKDQSGDNRMELFVALKNAGNTMTDHLIFTIEDDGDCMTTDEIETAFMLPDEPTLSSTEIHERLELRLCWQIARLLKGFIRIDPNYRQGRRVIVCLPDNNHLLNL